MQPLQYGFQSFFGRTAENFYIFFEKIRQHELLAARIEPMFNYIKYAFERREKYCTDYVL